MSLTKPPINDRNLTRHYRGYEIILLEGSIFGLTEDKMRLKTRITWNSKWGLNSRKLNVYFVVQIEIGKSIGWSIMPRLIDGFPTADQFDEWMLISFGNDMDFPILEITKLEFGWVEFSWALSKLWRFYIVKIEENFYVLMKFIAYWNLILEKFFKLWYRKPGFTDISTWTNYFPRWNYDPDPILSKTLSLQLM